MVTGGGCEGDQWESRGLRAKNLEWGRPRTKNGENEDLGLLSAQREMTAHGTHPTNAFPHAARKPAGAGRWGPRVLGTLDASPPSPRGRPEGRSFSAPQTSEFTPSALPRNTHQSKLLLSKKENPEKGAAQGPAGCPPGPTRPAGRIRRSLALVPAASGNPDGFEVGVRGGARSHKVASAPSSPHTPTHTPLGQEKLWDPARHTQKKGSISAKNSAAASIRAAHRHRAAGPPGRVPAPPGARQGAKSIPGRLRSFQARVSPPSGAPQPADKDAEAAEGKGRAKERLTLGGRRLCRTPASDSAGVWRGGPRRKALAQLRAGAPLGEHRELPAPPGPAPRAPRCRRATQPRSPAAASAGAGLYPPRARLHRSRHRPHPVTSQPSAPSSVTLPPRYSAVCVSHPPQPTCSCRSLGSQLPLPGAPTRTLKTPRSPGRAKEVRISVASFHGSQMIVPVHN
ncbi:basic salivary proline-rich protein 1-like [Ochotona princeps]|uniref:basic salivary proline-rich protein 1-like n=1 Tax=Ochotona princeps TaxID=9978 RepID=UPI002714C7B8|nr:basic salivary proline-rich protein 1-like [Ochotona princeps]